jgi:hypothetical protein
MPQCTPTQHNNKKEIYAKKKKRRKKKKKEVGDAVYLSVYWTSR